MNNSNPLIPQGSLLEQQTKGRARFKVAVFCVVALHVLFFTGLLMVGCKRDTSATPPENTAPTNTVDTATPPPALETNLPVPTIVDTNPPTAHAPVATNHETTTPPSPVPGPGATGGTATEYVVTKGDSFYSIGKKMGVSMKAIQAANPDVNPSKLKLGQKLQIPAPTTGAAVPSASTGGASAMVDSGSSETYTVKSGDSLTAIAKKHGTTVKAIRSANNMKTDRIKVGDKLKLPAKTSAPATPPTVDTAPAPAATSSVPALPPAPGAR
ncbi:MAG: hypothetical protein JWQ71_913 [Pedosphaera sp.]|nr:hypothetical protein [Pedosphaera sp.]